MRCKIYAENYVGLRVGEFVVDILKAFHEGVLTDRLAAVLWGRLRHGGKIPPFTKT